MPPLKASYLPESYNQLRKELHDNWPLLWKKVQWYLAFDWPLFIENMNKLLDVEVSGNQEVADVCTAYLQILHSKKSIIILH
jgi:hypothetical protein